MVGVSIARRCFVRETLFGALPVGRSVYPVRGFYVVREALFGAIPKPGFEWSQTNRRFAAGGLKTEKSRL